MQTQDFFARPAPDVAADLIGGFFAVNAVGGVIVETEAYAPDDPASHSFRGRTLRNGAMFGDPGDLYVYRSYGMHWCVNFVCLPGSAVLLRAIEPRAGLDLMRARRGQENPRLLCAGPGRLCQALAITGDLDGASLSHPPFWFEPHAEPAVVTAGTRIGISKAADVPWRFAVAGSPYLSRRL